MTKDKDGKYRLGKKTASEGTVFGIIQSIVKKSPDYAISYERLNAEMRKVKTWSNRVTANPSYKGIGTHEWCHGWILGAVNKLYLEKV